MSPAKTITLITLAALLGCARVATVKPAPAAEAAGESEWRQATHVTEVLEGPLDAILYRVPAERYYATTPTAP
jgi:hypothetical protein